MKSKPCRHCAAPNQHPLCPTCEDTKAAQDIAATRHARRRNLFTISGWPPELGPVQEAQLRLPLFGPNAEKDARPTPS